MHFLIKSICILLFCSNFCFGQIGNEFWFAAPDLQEAHGDDPIIFRFSAFEEDAGVTISQPGNAAFKKIEFTIKKNTSKSIDLTYLKNQIECNLINTPQNRALYIKASCKISCYYDIADHLNGDIFTLKGENALGLKFTIPQQMSLSSWNYPLYTSTFTVLATENNTNIKVRPTKNLEGFPDKKEIIITLQKGQTYTFQNISSQPNKRAGGTLVLADKPIAITIKDDSIQLPGYGCADTAGDQLIPDDLAGKEFIIMKGYFFIPDRYYIYPIADATKIYINGILKDTLNLGEYYEGFLSEASCYITTTSPVQIFQLSGFGCEIGGGILPGITCTGSNAVNVARATQQAFFINIITEKKNIGFFTFNGLNNIIDSTDFEEVKGTNGKWMICRKKIPVNILKPGESGNVANKNGLFHLGIIHGDEGSTTRFGYFSNFSNSIIKFENILETDCEVNKTLCYGAAINLKPILDSTVTYKWDGPNGFQSTNLNLAINEFKESDAGFYTLTVNGGICGVAKKRIYLSNPEINPLKADFDINKDTQCLDKNQFEFMDKSVSLNGSNIIKREWYVSGVKKNDSEILKYSASDTGNYKIMLFIQDENKCVDNMEKMVSILPAPKFKIDLIGKSKFCEGDSSTIKLNITDNNYSYQIKWFKNKILLPDELKNQLTIKSSGDFRVEVVNEFNCNSLSEILPIEVYPKPSISLVLTPTKYICDSVAVTLNASSNGLVYWYLNNLRISGMVGNQIKVNRGGEYSAEAISVNGCTTAGDKVIVLENINIANPLFSFSNTCVNKEVLYQNITKDNFQSKYFWVFGDGNSSTEKSPVHVYNKAGNYNVSLTVKIDECPNQFQIKTGKIQIEEAQKGIRYPVINVSRNLPQIITARNIGTSYQWRPGTGLSDLYIFNPNFDSRENKDYLIDISTVNNCLFTDTLQVYVFDQIDILVPEAFSPNGDGSNDKLQFFAVGISSFTVFRIFNRWGQLLFESFDENNYWDGTFNGVLQPIDSYVWIAEAIGTDGKQLKRRGQSILIR